MPNESGAGGALQQPNATLPGEIATRPSNISSTHEASHSSTQHPMKAFPEPQPTDSVDQSAEQPQDAEADRSLLQHKVASTVGRPAFSVYDRFD